MTTGSCSGMISSCSQTELTRNSLIKPGRGFLSLLYKVQVAFGVKQAKQNAVDEAVCLILVMGSYMQRNRPNKVPATLPDDYKSDVISAASTHTRVDRLQQILQWMDRFEMVLKLVQWTKVGPSSGQCFR